jgi:hypothetical protein
VGKGSRFTQSPHRDPEWARRESGLRERRRCSKVRNGRPEGGGAFPASRKRVSGSNPRPAVPVPSGEGLGGEESPRLHWASVSARQGLWQTACQCERSGASRAFSASLSEKTRRDAFGPSAAGALTLYKRCRKIRRAVMRAGRNDLCIDHSLTGSLGRLILRWPGLIAHNGGRNNRCSPAGR